MDRSPLSRLPAELRLYIYELALTVSSEDAPAIIKPFPSDYESDGEVPNSVTIKNNGIDTYPLAPTQTCRAIRCEASDLFYKLNTFRIVQENDYIPFFSFVDLIGPHAISVLRTLEVQFNSNDYLCMDHDDCLGILNSMVDLRKWSFLHPHVALSARLHWPGQSAFAEFDLQNLYTPYVEDAEGYFERTFGDVAELSCRLTIWNEGLRPLTLEDALRTEAEEAKRRGAVA